MAFRLVSSGGAVTDPAVVTLFGSGVIHVGGAVVFNRVTGVPVAPVASGSSRTAIFGVSTSYIQGASEAEVSVIPFASGQLWEADCVNAASTAHVGVRHIFETDMLLRNTATDVTGFTGVFEALAVVGASTGSGKLLGRFITANVPVDTSATTFV